MTTYFLGNKKEASKLEFTKAKVIPNQIYLLSNPLNVNRMQIRESHNNGDIVSIVNTINNTITTPITATVTSTSTFTHTKLEKYEKKIISHDSGYLIPLDVDQNIKKLSEEKNINTNHYFKIDNDHCYNNCFLYQLV